MPIYESVIDLEWSTASRIVKKTMPATRPFEMTEDVEVEMEVEHEVRNDKWRWGVDIPRRLLGKRRGCGKDCPRDVVALTPTVLCK